MEPKFNVTNISSFFIFGGLPLECGFYAHHLAHYEKVLANVGLQAQKTIECKQIGHQPHLEVLIWALESHDTKDKNSQNHT